MHTIPPQPICPEIPLIAEKERIALFGGALPFLISIGWSTPRSSINRSISF